MRRERAAASALLWLGLACVLAPVALVCLALMVIVAIAQPLAGLIFLAAAIGIGRVVWGRSE